MWTGWRRLAKHGHAVGASLTVEWSHDSDLHRLKSVAKFMALYGMERRKVAGCVFGLKSIAAQTRGLPLCKAWGIWTSSKSLSLALSGPEVRCQGGHPSTAVSGKDTAHSGTYTDHFARYVIKSLCTPREEVLHAMQNGKWSI